MPLHHVALAASSSFLHCGPMAEAIVAARLGGRTSRVAKRDAFSRRAGKARAANGRARAGFGGGRGGGSRCSLAKHDAARDLAAAVDLGHENVASGGANLRADVLQERLTVRVRAGP